MKRNENPDALLARWYAGKTTDGEETQLRERFANADRSKRTLPTNDDHEIDAMLFAGFRELGAESLSPCPTVRPNRRSALRMVWKSTAVAAMLAVGIVLGLQFRTPYCYIDGVAVYDKETALAATDCLKGLSALELPDRMLEKLLEN